jgi:NADP-dependent 3-hydroxy acid dehydrogenase YdfG
MSGRKPRWRRDSVARNVGSLDAVKVKYDDRLVPLTLDVSNKDTVDAAVEQAHKRLGHIEITPATACSGPSKRSASKRSAHRSKPTCSALCG